MPRATAPRPAPCAGRLSSPTGRRVWGGAAVPNPNVRANAPALAVVALLSACTLPDAAPPPPAIGPEIIVRFSERGQPARDLLERVAARCWLDGILRGAAMVVDRQTGRVIIVSDDEKLLAADFLAPQDGRSRVRLSGPVLVDTVTQRRLVESLDLAARTGKTDCPIATG
jgi:hypothetical protein